MNEKWMKYEWRIKERWRKDENERKRKKIYVLYKKRIRKIKSKYKRNMEKGWRKDERIKGAKNTVKENRKSEKKTK